MGLTPTIHTRKAADGIRWIRSGLRLFGRHPLSILTFVLMGMIIIWTISLLPIVGQAFALILMPAAWIGMLGVCRDVDRGKTPGPHCYTDPLREPFTRLHLIKIGVVSAIAAGLLTTGFAMLPSGTGKDAAAHLTHAQTAWVLGSLVIWVPLQMAIWFAPPLVAWHGMSAGKAMFFSFFACWRNRRPMIVYFLSLIALATLLVLALGAMVDAFSVGETTVGMVLAPLSLVVGAATQTCAYAMYRDIVE